MPRGSAHYDPDVPPLARAVPDQTLARLLADRRAREPPARAGAPLQGRDAHLRRRSTARATRSRRRSAALGVRRGDRVALLLPNCPQFFIAEFGAWKAGAIVVAAQSDLHRARARRGAASDTRDRTVVTLTPFYERVKRVQPRTALRRVIATNIKEYLPPLLRLLFTLFKEKKDGHRITLAPGDLWLGDLLRRHRRRAAAVVPIGPTIRR